MDMHLQACVLIWELNCRNPTLKGCRMTLTLPKWGLGSPLGLLKTQSSIVGVKTPRFEMFFIPLEKGLEA